MPERQSHLRSQLKSSVAQFEHWTSGDIPAAERAAMTQADTLTVIEAIIAFNQLHYDFLLYCQAHVDDCKKEIAVMRSLIEKGQAEVLQLNIRIEKSFPETLSVEAVQPQPATALALTAQTDSHALLLDSVLPKEQPALTGWGLFRQARIKASLSPLYQVSEHVNSRLSLLEHSLLHHAQHSCAQHFARVERKHKACMDWMAFLLSVYQQAEEGVKAVIGLMEEDIAKRKKMQREIALGLFMVALAPIGLDKLAKPLLTGLEELSLDLEDSQERLQGFFEATLSQAHEGQQEDEQAQRQAFSLTHSLRAVSQYCDHKWQGVARSLRHCFNSDSAPALSTELSLSAESLIAELIHREIAKIMANAAEEASFYQRNSFEKLWPTVEEQARGQLNEMLTGMFALLEQQYTVAEEEMALLDVLAQIQFNDEAVGVEAVNQSMRKTLEAKLVAHVEAVMLLAYGREQTNFLGKPPVEEKKAEYGRKLGKRSTALTTAILQRKALLDEEQEITETTLLAQGRGAKLKAVFSRSPAGLLARQAELDGLFDRFSSASLRQDLRGVVMDFASKTLPEFSAPDILEGVASSGWVAEARLRQQVVQPMAGLLAYAEQRQLLKEEEHTLRQQAEVYQRARQTVANKKPVAPAVKKIHRWRWPKYFSCCFAPLLSWLFPRRRARRSYATP